MSGAPIAAHVDPATRDAARRMAATPQPAAPIPPAPPAAQAPIVEPTLIELQQRVKANGTATATAREQYVAALKAQNERRALLEETQGGYQKALRDLVGKLEAENAALRERLSAQPDPATVDFDLNITPESLDATLTQLREAKESIEELVELDPALNTLWEAMDAASGLLDDLYEAMTRPTAPTPTPPPTNPKAVEAASAPRTADAVRRDIASLDIEGKKAWFRDHPGDRDLLMAAAQGK